MFVLVPKFSLRWSRNFRQYSAGVQICWNFWDIFFRFPEKYCMFYSFFIFISQRRKAQSSSHIFCSLQCCCLKNMVFQTQNPFCNTLWGAEAISVFTASYEPKAWHERHGVLEQIIINTYM